ncbi:hypothetical protein D3C84_960250 [compost metagenome]
MVERGEHFYVSLTQALRVDNDADVERKAAFFRIEVEVDRYHLADFHPEKLYRGIDLEPAQCLIEA